MCSWRRHLGSISIELFCLRALSSFGEYTFLLLSRLIFLAQLPFAFPLKPNYKQRIWHVVSTSLTACRSRWRDLCQLHHQCNLYVQFTTWIRLSCSRQYPQSFVVIFYRVPTVVLFCLKDASTFSTEKKIRFRMWSSMM